MKQNKYEIKRKKKEFCYTSVRFFRATMSFGRCFSRFLCSNNDLRLLRRAMLVGRFSIRLSHKTKACSWPSKPTDSGTSVRRLPPIESTCKLMRENINIKINVINKNILILENFNQPKINTKPILA